MLGFDKRIKIKNNKNEGRADLIRLFGNLLLIAQQHRIGAFEFHSCRLSFAENPKQRDETRRHGFGPVDLKGQGGAASLGGRATTSL